MKIFNYLTKLYLNNAHNFRELVKLSASQLSSFGIINSAKRLVNELDTSWVEKSPKVGIRPQLLNTNEMRLEMDFLIKHGNNSTHILNSISPAFTSSFAVARHVVNHFK